MPLVVCHQSQCIKGKYRCHRCFYILTIKAAYHHGSWKGLKLVRWRKGENSLFLYYFLWLNGHQSSILQYWGIGGLGAIIILIHKSFWGWSLCKFVVVNVKIEGLFAWFSIFANLPVWSLLLVFVKFYSDFSSIDVKSYCYSTRRTQIDCWTRCHFLFLIL